MNTLVSVLTLFLGRAASIVRAGLRDSYSLKCFHARWFENVFMSLAVYIVIQVVTVPGHPDYYVLLWIARARSMVLDHLYGGG
jgi:hypothetical protein